MDSEKNNKNIGWLGMKRFSIKVDPEDEKCKYCQHCEYYLKATNRRDTIELGMILFLVLAICLMFGAVFYVFKKAVTPNREIDIGGYKVKIKEDSIADILIDNGFCTVDDIQKMIDELLEQ